jgi:PAS domain S-box-containing protein
VASLPSIKILVVDDEPNNVVALKGVLSQPDYELVTACNGEDALRASLTDEFAVVLLDVVMPGMDGFEVASLLRSRPRSRHTPIIFLSATGTDGTYSTRGYQVGAVDYLSKPSDPDMVRAKVAVFVELYRKNQQLAVQESALREAERREQARAVAELQMANERRYRNLAEAIPQIVWVASVGGAMEYVNARFAELTGVDEVRGDAWHAGVHADDVGTLSHKWRVALKTEQPFTVECRLLGRDGEARWYLCRGLPELTREGRLDGWIGTFTDIHEQKLGEERAQAQVRERDEFLLIASHELNTPLTSLLLQLQRVERALSRGNPAPVKSGVEVASRSARRLQDLVRMLLDTSRISAGRLKLERTRTDLSQLVRDVVTRHTDEASRAGAQLALEAVEPLWGQWDRDRLDQVVTNLTTNAIKYGDRKPVLLRVARDEEEAILSVHDRGIGIAPEDQKRIFDRFARAVSERNFGGLGLGLYIVGQIVAAHGGRVSVASKPGDGTTFTVALPLEIG